MKINRFKLYTDDGRAKDFDNVTYSMSDTNNALYIYDDKRKVKGIFNKDHIYGIIDAEREFASYDEAKAYYITNKISTMFQVKFDNGDYIYVCANKYDYNVYTNVLTFSEYVNDSDKGWNAQIGVFNMENLIGFQKVTFEGGEDELREEFNN